MTTFWDDIDRDLEEKQQEPEKQANLWDQIDQDLGDEEQAKDQQLLNVFHAAQGARDNYDAILAVHRETGAPIESVERNYAAFSRAAAAAKFDPRRFREDNPVLYEALLETPEMAPLLLKEQQLSWYTKLVRAKDRWKEDHPLATAGVGLWFAPAVMASGSLPFPTSMEELRGIDKALKGETQSRSAEELLKSENMLYQQSPLAGLPGPVRREVIKDAWSRRRTQSKIARLETQSMLWLLSDEEMEEQGYTPQMKENLRKRWYDAQVKIAKLQEGLGPEPYYGSGEIEKTILEGVNTTASEMDALEAMGVLGGAGAVVGGVAAGYATKSAAGARAGAVLGARAGMLAGSFVGSFEQEAGSAFQEFLEAKDDSGKRIDPILARNAAVLYGVLSAGVETGELAWLSGQVGPIGQAIRNGENKAAVRAMLRDRNWRGLIKRVGTSWAKGALGEGAEEGIQQAMQILTLHGAKMVQAGGWQQFDTAEAKTQILDAAARGTIGSAIAPMALGEATILAGTYGIKMESSRRAAKQVQAIVEATESPAARALPRKVAQLVQKVTEDSGHPVRSLWVDPTTLTEVLHEVDADVDQVAKDLMGEQGPQRMRDALERYVDEPGSRATLEVSLEEFMEKWGSKELADKLVDDITVKDGWLTAREQKAAMEEDGRRLKARAEELVQEQVEQGGWQPQSEVERQFLDAMETSLQETGQYTDEEAQQAVAVERAALETMAKRSGVPVETLMQSRTVSIRRATEGDIARVTGQIDANAPAASQALTERFLGMSLEERARQIYIDENTGVLTPAGLEALPANETKPMVAHISVEGTKWKNQESHAAGNLLYRATAQALAGVAENVAKWGGDFVVPVADQAEADRIAKDTQEALAKTLREANPELADQIQGLQITAHAVERGGAMGAAVKQATEAHAARKQELEAGGARAERGTRPMGLPEMKPEQLALPGESVLGRELAQEHIAEAAGMTDQELYERAYIDPGTGLLSRQGFLQSPPKKNTAAFDLNGLGAINKEHGEAAGDTVLATFGMLARMMGGAAVDMAHLSGDEYAAKHDDPVVLQQYVDTLRTLCDNVTVELDGQVVTDNLAFEAEIGETYDEADRRVDATKKAAKARGPGYAGATRRRRAQDRRRGNLPERSGSLSGGARAQVFARVREGVQGSPGGAVSEGDAGDHGRAAPGRGTEEALAAVRRELALLGNDPRKLVAALQAAEKEGAGLANALAQYQATVKQLRETGVIPVESRKWGIWDQAVQESIGDQNPSSKEDAEYRAGKKPGPFADATFDAVNHELDLRGEDRVSGAAEAFDLLARHFAKLEERGTPTNEDYYRAVEFVSQNVPGYDRLRLPNDVVEARAEARARAEEEDFYREQGGGGETLFQRAPRTPEFERWFGESKVVNEKGEPQVIYHGTKRPDRVGARFLKGRATSGPMPFFTSDAEVASGYATGKSDTSVEVGDYADWFKMKTGRTEVNLERAWWHLTNEERNRLGEKLPHIVEDEETGKFRLGGPEEYGPAPKESWDYELRSARGNVLKAAKELWLNSATLFDQEEEFLEVLKLAGLGDVFRFDSPHAEYPAVYPVFLSIKNPFDTSAITPEVMTALDRASRRQRRPGPRGYGADFWDKETKDPTEWMTALREDQQNNTTHAWTSIPDWVTRTLKKLGFDGIKDSGGKYGGKEHAVWIPFEPTQVKSATGNRGTFDPTSPSILRQDEPEGGGGGPPRGWVEASKKGLKRAYSIFVTDFADVSTPLHELSHTYLEMLGDMAATENAPQQIKNDWAKALKWLGVEERGQLTGAHKEKWAAAFEAYIMEGKPPSQTLADVFQRLRLWLLDIYKSITALGVELDDDIRGVFDRMLATEDEIVAMQAAMGIQTPMFKNAEEAGMTEGQYQAYLKDRAEQVRRAGLRVHRQVAEAQKRVTTEEWKKEVRKNKAQATAEWDRRPDWRAWRYLRRGDITSAQDGHLLEDISSPEDGRLDKDMVQEILGKGHPFIRRLRGRMDVDGLDPATAAAQFGYKGPRAMFEALMAMPDQKQWVRERAEELTKKAHPELATERERIEEVVARAYHLEGSSDSLLKEWQSLQTRAGQQWTVPVKAVKLAAKQLSERMTARRLNLSAAIAKERTAAEKAVAAAARGDFAAAARHKRDQLLAHYAYREMDQARQDRDALDRLVKKLQTKQRRIVLNKAGQFYVDAVNNILEAMGVQDPETDETALDERMPILGVVAELNRQEIAVHFDVGRLAMLIATPHPGGWRSLEVADIRVLKDALSQLYAAARQQNSIIVDGKRMEIDGIARDILTDARARPDKGPLPASESAKRSWWSKQRIRTQSGKQLPQAIDATLTEPEVMIGQLGPTAEKVLFGGFLKAREEEDELTKAVTQKVTEMWERLPKQLKKRRFEFLEDLRGVDLPADLNREGRLRDRQWMWMVALNMGNASNMQRLLGGYGWEESAVRGWLERNMTEPEWRFVQDVWDLMDKELYPKMATVYEAINGVKPDKIEPVPFNTQFGIFKGGYFPARYDPVASRLGETQAIQALERRYSQRAGRFSVAKSFTKERAGKYTDVISLEWGVVPAHVVSVIHYVSHEPFVRDAARVVNSAPVQTAIRRHLGAKYPAQLDAWLHAVTNWSADAIPTELSALYEVIGRARSHFVISTLGYSLTVLAGDLTNPFISWAKGDVSLKHLAAAALQTIPLVNLGDTMRRNRTKSAELRHRHQNMGQLLRRQLADIGVRGSKGTASRILDKVQESSFYFMEAMDRIGSTVIWEAAYRTELAKPEVTEEMAVERADAAVRSALPSNNPSEQPAFLRDRRGIRALVAFYSYFSKLYNVQKTIWQDVGMAFEEGKVRGTLAATAAMGRSLAVILIANVLAEFLSGRGPEEEEEPEEWVVRKVLAGPFVMLPLIGAVAEEGAGLFTSWLWHGEPRQRQFSMRASPAVSGVERFVKAIGKIEAEGSDVDQRILAILDALGAFAGIPVGSSQVKRTLGYTLGEDGLREDIEQGDVAGIPAGLVYGKREGQPLNPVTAISGQ